MRIYIQKVPNFIIFDYLTNTIYNILNKKYNCTILLDLKNVVLNNDDILIMVPQFCWNFINCIDKKKHNIKIFLINTEPIYKGKIFDLNLFDHVSLYTNKKINIFDYAINNVLFVKKSNIYLTNNFNIDFLPWTYNSYIETFIKYNEEIKDIDILFIGWIPNNSRREKMYKEFINKNKDKNYNYNIKFSNTNNNCNDVIFNYKLFSRAKIIIHIFNYEDVKIFDFYRFTILLSNKLFFITEDFDEISNNYITNYKDHLIYSPYDNFVDFVFNNLKTMSDNERQKIANRNYEWYKNLSNYDEIFEKMFIKNINL